MFKKYISLALVFLLFFSVATAAKIEINISIKEDTFSIGDTITLVATIPHDYKVIHWEIKEPGKKWKKLMKSNNNELSIEYSNKNILNKYRVKVKKEAEWTSKLTSLYPRLMQKIQ